MLELELSLAGCAGIECGYSHPFDARVNGKAMHYVARDTKPTRTHSCLITVLAGDKLQYPL